MRRRIARCAVPVMRVTFTPSKAMVPADRVLVTESGILAPADVQLMRQADVHAFLVGEAFMRQPDPGRALSDLFAA